MHSATASRRPAPAVALIYDAAESGAQMRDALVGLGLEIVYETNTRELDRAALARSPATVVVIDLDARNGAGLGEVHDLLDHEHFRVVFNDGEVSSGLTGWDRARWQRHLAAKIFGAGLDTDPPRPASAQSVPARAVAAPGPLVAEVAPAPSGAEPPNPAASAAPALEPEPGVPAPFAVADEAISIDLAMPAAPGAQEPEVASDPPQIQGAVLEMLDLIDFPGLDLPTELPPPYIADDLPSFEELDALMAADAEPSLIDRTHTMDLEYEGAAAEQPAPAEGEDAGVPAAPVAVPTAAEWTLEDVFDGLAEPPPPPASAFGIEVIQPAAFLAPDVEEGVAPVDAPALTLELVPLEEAVAPAPVEEAASESWMGSAAQATVRRVWVLGASVGGPESVREFLAALPRDYPALFLLAQHIGDEFVDMMARQLAKATPLTVRTPTHGERVGHGDVVIVPAAQRLLVDADGVVVLQRDGAAGAPDSTIDRVLKDCADRFGANAGAIVFSGMGDDAVEGCRHLVEKGGKVYAQRPDTCVVSTMVDAVCGAELVSYVGSPQELAERVRMDAA